MAPDALREGIIAINKPYGMSSAQVLRECQLVFNPSRFFQPLIESEINKLTGSGRNRRDIKQRLLKKARQVKIGHGGTLDPMATGVLILGIGSATKSLDQFLSCTKTYEATVVFGASTDTYDRVGRILTKKPYDHITKEKVQAALEGFKGKQKQIPPLYSALKMQGKPLYEYAREGKAIPREIEARDVEATLVEIVEWYEPGKHNFQWPTDEAEPAERNLAEQVWRVQKQQETTKTLTPEEKEVEDKAIADHESFKRKFEERQDDLIRDSPSGKTGKKNSGKSNNNNNNKQQRHLMSGALGEMPENFTYSTKGSNLVPLPPGPGSPPPWSDQGPPAVKVRLIVTSGYYVRSFCHDLGAQLDSAALMAELCRTRQSDFTVGGVNCLEMQDLNDGEEVWGPKVANMIGRWNGEPVGLWPGPGAPGPKMEMKQTPSSQETSAQQLVEQKPAKKTYPPPEKRRRSRSPNSSSPPRKIAARNAENRQTPRRPSRERHSEDEKSWNGFET